MPNLLIRYPDGTEAEHELAGELTVGRAEGNDLVLAEGGVSRKHARFYVDGGQVLVEDSGSANGTFVDGDRIAGPTPLGPRAQVVIGDYEISLKAAGAPRSKRPAPKNGGGGDAEIPADKQRMTMAQAPIRAARSTKVLPAQNPEEKKAALARRPRPEPAAQKAAGPQLRGITGPWLNKVYPIRRGVMTVGRVPGVDIQVDDDSVSRRHAEIDCAAEGVVLRDLGSANGTTINGEPVSEDTPLRSGDVVAFGMIEMSFDAGEDAAIVPRRGAAPARGARGGSADAGGAEAKPKSKKLFIVAGAVALLFVVGGIVKMTSKGSDQGDVGPGPTGAGSQEPLDPQAQLTEFLSACRSYASTEGNEPDWDKAAERCNKALDIDPINSEALGLMKRIHAEQECREHANRADKEMKQLRDEEAIRDLEKITSACAYYYLKLKPKVTDVVDQVTKHTKEDCKNYGDNNQWEQALPKCRLYMEIACQSMKEDDLIPPVGKNVTLSMGKPRKNEWRPTDPMYLNYLKALHAIEPTAALQFICPKKGVIENRVKEESPEEKFRKEFASYEKSPELREAMTLYFAGKANEAMTLLQKVRIMSEKAAIHAQADDIRKDISTVLGDYNDGNSSIQIDDPEKAAPPFHEALQIDEKLMHGHEFAEKNPSWFRRNIQQDMAAKCYERGKFSADRQDFKKACKVWKIGYDFWKGNADLLRALTNVCTAQAGRAVADASSCDDLTRAMEFAVDGDGVSQKVEAKRAELHCK